MASAADLEELRHKYDGLVAFTVALTGERDTLAKEADRLLQEGEARRFALQQQRDAEGPGAGRRNGEGGAVGAVGAGAGKGGVAAVAVGGVPTLLLLALFALVFLALGAMLAGSRA